MSPTDLDEEIREALGIADDGPEEPEPPRPRRRSPRARRGWWAAPDWWLRTAASAAVGKAVGAALTGVALLLAWLAAKAAGWVG